MWFKSSYIYVCLYVCMFVGDFGIQGCGDMPDSTKCSRANAIWPGSSPYVTSVGATQISGGNEIVCSVISGINNLHHIVYYLWHASSTTGSMITGGGGFSKVNSRKKVKKIYIYLYQCISFIDMIVILLAYL